MKDLSQLHFLSMHVQHSPSGIYLSQHQYMIDILDRDGISLEHLEDSCRF
jgi:hypothetical protein